MHNVDSELIEISKKAMEYWKKPETDRYIQKFCYFIRLKMGPYPEKFRRALNLCVETKDSFPTITDMLRAIEELPRRPIDYIADGQVDFHSLSGCEKCRDGLVRMFELQDPDHELYAYCQCPKGEYLNRRGTKGVLMVSELEKKGYKPFRARK